MAVGQTAVEPKTVGQTTVEPRAVGQTAAEILHKCGKTHLPG